MTTDEMVSLAAKYRDDWAEGLRFRLIQAIFDDAHNYMGYVNTPEDMECDEYSKVCEMMEMSVGLELWDVSDVS